ncbi:MAG: tRNA-dependent cyclodipeptide synthase [Patescibacteria group bacterium]
MKINKVLNTIIEEVKSKNFNILIGISLGNKFFSEENIKEYILWALENTKEKVLILIPDKIHAINYEVKNKWPKEKAMKKAIREGEKVIEKIKNILDEISPNKEKIEIIKWEDIETNNHLEKVKVLKDEFLKNSQFKEKILSTVKENVQSDKLSDDDYEKLCLYPLEELPFLISGVKYKGIHYDLLPYPGISKIDDLIIDLQEGKNFPEITQKLNIKSKLRAVIDLC